MSFILDALKKSETDRQQQRSAEFSGVPTSGGSTGAPRWLWALGLLLAINLLVLLGVLFQPDTGPPGIPPTGVSETREPAATQPAADKQPPAEAAPAEPGFAEQVAVAKQNAPARSESAAVRPQPSQAVSTPLPGVVYPAPPPESTLLPTLQEVRANGSVSLPELHLDIHVYSEVPDDRFVFINMSKQREKSQLSEGPFVEEITPDGVILEYRGTSFLLPRD